MTQQTSDQIDVQTTEFKHTLSLTHELVLSDKSLGLTKQQRQSIESVLKAYTLAAKNITNSTLFIIKNLQSSYHYVKEEGHYKIKAKLHKNTTRVQQRAVSDTKTNHDVSNKVNQSRSEASKNNSIPKHHEFAGKRDGTTYTTTHISRSKNKPNQATDKIKVHADVHGSLNIGRKFLPAFNFSYLGNNMNVFKYQVKRLAKRGKKGLIHLKRDFFSARMAACFHTL